MVSTPDALPAEPRRCRTSTSNLLIRPPVTACFTVYESMNIKRLLLFFFRVARGRANCDRPGDTAPLIATAKCHLIPPNAGTVDDMSETELSGEMPRDMTDGFHLVVDALKLTCVEAATQSDSNRRLVGARGAPVELQDAQHTSTTRNCIAAEFTGGQSGGHSSRGRRAPVAPRRAGDTRY